MSDEIDDLIRRYFGHLVQDELSEAESVMREAIALLEAESGPTDARLLSTMEQLAGLLWCTNRQSESRDWAEKIQMLRIQLGAEGEAIQG